MPFVASRRRVLAFCAIAATLLSRPALAQSTGGAATAGSGGPVTVDIGNWRVISIANNSQAFIPEERISIRAWSTDQGDKRVGGSAELELQYWSTGRGYQGTLKISTVGTFSALSQSSSGFPTRVLADGKDIATLSGGETDVDLTQYFGARLDDLRQVGTLSVVMTIEGEDHTVYEADLTGISETLDRMRAVPDYNYNVLGAGPQTGGAGGSGGGGSSQGCFITTACCGLVGLPDDCFELRALRAFRDGVMLATPDGREDVARYYNVAPAILAEMERRGDERRLLGLYASHILPSAVLARLGLRRLPRRLYSSMMRRLEARYLPGRT